MTPFEMNAELEGPGLSREKDVGLAHSHVSDTQNPPLIEVQIIDIPDTDNSQASLTTNGVTRKILDIKASVLKVKDAAVENWKEHDKKQALLISWLGYASFKMAGRVKLPDAVVGYASMGTYSATNNAALTALSAAILSTVWSRSAAGAMNYTIDNNKGAYESTGSNFKSLNDNFELALPGFDSYHEQPRDLDEDKTALVKIGNDLSLRTRRGIVATNRLTPYLSAAGRAGHTIEERKKLANAISIESGIVKGAMFFGIAELINKTAVDNPNFAEDVQHAVEHPVFWGVIGGVTMAGEFVKNKISARRTHEDLQLETL